MGAMTGGCDACDGSSLNDRLEIVRDSRAHDTVYIGPGVTRVTAPVEGGGPAGDARTRPGASCRGPRGHATRWRTALAIVREARRGQGPIDPGPICTGVAGACRCAGSILTAHVMAALVRPPHTAQLRHTARATPYYATTWGVRGDIKSPASRGVRV